MSDPFGILFERARRGDRDAIEALLRPHLPGLRAFVRLQSGPLLRAMESQSDLVQTVCREALGDLGGIDCSDADAFRQWLFKVAVNKLRGKVDYHRAQKRDAGRRVEADSGDAESLLEAYASFCTPSHHAGVREELERIEHAFDSLPDEYRQVITEACVLGRSHKEIAAELGKSEAGARKLLSRARARLALLLDL